MGRFQGTKPRPRRGHVSPEDPDHPFHEHVMGRNTSATIYRFGRWTYCPPSYHDAAPDVESARRIDPGMFGSRPDDNKIIGTVLRALARPTGTKSYRGSAPHRLRRGPIGSRDFVWEHVNGCIRFEAPESMHEYVWKDGVWPTDPAFAIFVKMAVDGQLRLGKYADPAVLDDRRQGAIGATGPEQQLAHGLVALKDMASVMEKQLAPQIAAKEIQEKLQRIRKLAAEIRRSANDHDIALADWILEIPNPRRRRGSKKKRTWKVDQ